MADKVAKLGWTLATAGAALGAALVFWSQQLALRDTSHSSGWTLLALIVFLIAFGLRKKLPHPPLIGAKLWLRAHLAVGILALIVFAYHLRGWPQGRLEWVLLLLFGLTAASGLIGWLLSRTIPRLLTRHGPDVVYESIPRACRRLRARAQDLVATATGASTRSVLGQIYRRNLGGYFAVPKPWWREFGAQRRGRRLRHVLNQSRRYLGEDEREAADELERLIRQRTALDTHRVWQGLLKGWLFFHVPLSCALLVVVALHVFVVHAYTGAAG